MLHSEENLKMQQLTVLFGEFEWG